MGPRYALPCALLVCLSGCASIFKVKSDPAQAEVFVVDAKGEKKSIGKTPVELPMSAVREAVGESTAAGQYFTVLVEKAEFSTERLLVPASRFGTLVTELDVKLKNGPVQEKKLASEALDSLFLAQKLALSKEYERAQIELDKLLAAMPELPRALSMRGSIYFLQKNYPESVKWYEAAIKADPKMEDAVKMLAKARTALGSGGGSARQPAAAPGKKGGGP